MLPKINRLTVPLFQKNPVSYSRAITLWFYIAKKTSTDKNFRCTVTVAKKLDKRATKRNRTKRLIYEMVFSQIPKLSGNMDVLIKAQKMMEKDQNHEILDSLISAFKLLGMYANN